MHTESRLFTLGPSSAAEPSMPTQNPLQSEQSCIGSTDLTRKKRGLRT